MIYLSVFIGLMSLVVFACIIMQTLIKRCRDSLRFCWFIIALSAGTAVGCWHIDNFLGAALFYAITMWTLCFDLPPLQRRQKPPITPPEE